MPDLLLGLWREACRHIELPESIVRIATLVGRVLPAEVLLIRRLDAEHRLVETVAVGRTGALPAPHQARTPLAAPDVEQVIAWCRTGRLVQGSARERAGLVRLLAPDDLRGHVLTGPLVTESGALGVLLLATARPGFSAEQERMAAPLLEPLAAAYENHRRFHELARLREAAEAERSALLTRLKRQEIVEEIVGADGSLRPVMERVAQVAPTDAPVVILGETGTGKEVIARAIHARSARRNGPVLRVNCGAIPPELIDSELFGHEKGAFTGAVAQRKGWFERADGGTLFLDEVGDLPPAAQVRLLRILQDGTYERVGGEQTLPANLHTLAATHRDMEDLVRRGRFREDLWYRISVFPIYLPPLRSRRDDIPLIAGHFARNVGLRLAGVPFRVTDADMQLLLDYPWPGNVREMAAVIERAALLGGGQRLDLSGAMGGRTQAPLASAPEAPAPGPPGELLTLDEAMAHHIRQALEITAGRVEGPRGAARLLDVHPNTLRARMAKLGVDWKTIRTG